MKTKITAKNRARLNILNHIVSFSTATLYSSNSVSPPSNDRCFRHPEKYPPIGSLCRLIAGGMNTKWYLSWLVEIDAKSDVRSYSDRFLLESIDDGSLCWWNNVELAYLPTELINEFPSWRWSDKQYEFSDRVSKAFNKSGSYITLPCNPIFNGNLVTLKTRERYGFSDYSYERTFDDFRKLTMKDISNFYNEALLDKASKEKQK